MADGKWSKQESTVRVKQKGASQEQWIHMWKQHLKNWLWKPPKVKHETITKIITNQLDIKIGHFTRKELDTVRRKIKNRKAAGLNGIPSELWKTREYDDILLWHCNTEYNQNTIYGWTRGCSIAFLKKGDFGIAKDYRGIILTSIAAKIYNALLRNRIENT